MNITTRHAKISDYDAVVKIMNQVQQLHVEWRPDIYKNNGDFFSREKFEMSVGEDTVFVAESNGRVVGVMELVYRHIESPAHMTRDIIFIDSMAVEEACRGQGVGHLFFDRVREIRAQKGYDGIELQVNAKNRQAYEMYLKCGFTEKSINMELL